MLLTTCELAPLLPFPLSKHPTDDDVDLRSESSPTTTPLVESSISNYPSPFSARFVSHPTILPTSLLLPDYSSSRSKVLGRPSTLSGPREATAPRLPSSPRMNTSFPYPSFDGSSSWNMVAPQAQYYGAQNDHLYYQQQAHQAALAQQQQVAAGAFAYAPSAYAHPAAPQYYAQPQAQYVAPQAVAEPTRSRFAFAHAAPAHFEQRGFNLPPPAHHAYGHDEYMAEAQAYGHAESASRATLESEHMDFLLGRLAQSADSTPPSSDEYDHPSHNRPPHHRNDVAALQMMQQTDEPITYDLIPNVSSVPPPPPIERSAVPLADVATEMIWEVCRQGYLQAAERSSVATAASPAGVIGQPARGPRRSGGGEQFGVIGGGRARKVSQDGYDSSSLSSPSSSMPGTPSGFETVEDAAARRQRLASLGLGSFGGDMRSSSHSRTRAAPSPFPVEPSSAFRQFVRQILTATLVAPEDIVLALYYVSQVPLDKIIPPTPAEPGQDAQTTSFKAAPFKMVLGALMLANKTLQDNSYRNDTVRLPFSSSPPFLPDTDSSPPPPVLDGLRYPPPGRQRPRGSHPPRPRLRRRDP